ncbi:MULTISPECIES: hypothetical protein [Nostocales]|uniref:Uncharacterized protein n=1 Tax=Tolypothrix campylonemoides VB511288_2 TaxID=3232311 RepID=A0ABW8XN84_9CYAN
MLLRDCTLLASDRMKAQAERVLIAQRKLYSAYRMKAFGAIALIQNHFTQAKLCPSPLNCAKKASNLDALTTSPSTFPILRTW